jgi:hypothetical protein
MKIASTRIIAAAAFLCLVEAALAHRSQTSNPHRTSLFDVPATIEWLDTKLDLRTGEKIRFAASGEIKYPADKKHPDGKNFGPDGLERSYSDLLHDYAVADAGHGALIARLGPAESGQPFFVGETKDYQAPVAGRLFLGINQSLKDASGATGKFQVKIEVLDPGLTTPAAASVGGPPDSPIPAITPALLATIPRRVSDPQGNPGDMVNILLVGTEEEVLRVFSTAGWVKVDTSVQDTVVTAIIDSLEKKDYLTMPMSTLYLFKRPQDFGFAHAEPVRVAMSRNHLRIWKSPYEVDGWPLWCIAATHDIGFEPDDRKKNSVTHKIDPAIDGEREYVNATLTGTGLVAQRNHVNPADPLTEARTATGGIFHSDGRILVLLLKNTVPGK